MSLFLASEQMVCCNAHQTNISLISIVHRSTLRMNLFMFRKHSDSMLNKCCKTTSIYTVHTISKYNFNITAAEHLQILFKMWIFRFYHQCKINTIVSRRDHQVPWVNDLRKPDSQDSTRLLIQAMIRMIGTTIRRKSFKVLYSSHNSKGNKHFSQEGLWLGVGVGVFLLCFKMQKDKAFQDDVLRITAESVRKKNCPLLAHHTPKNINDVVK